MENEGLMEMKDEGLVEGVGGMSGSWNVEGFF